MAVLLRMVEFGSPPALASPQAFVDGDTALSRWPRAHSLYDGIETATALREFGATMGNWQSVSESKFAWEREALEFVRSQFPAHEPYRAWSNFEFIADDGSINEVDLLVFTPAGFFLIEIKSRPGRLLGDAGTWTWETEGRRFTDDNPLHRANLKAKKLKSLLERQKACQKKGPEPFFVPFIEPLVFCSALGLQCELQGNARMRVCLRDQAATDKESSKTPLADARGTRGILAAIINRDCLGLEPKPRSVHGKPLAKMLSQAIEQAGIRPSQRHRKVMDYVLGRLIDNGPGFQDWRAAHVQVAESVRRVRLYLVRDGATVADRQMIDRAALREFKLLETLQHPGILRCLSFTEHEVGPALIFEHDPQSIRLDHFLTQRNEQLSITARLDLVRQLAEVMRYAHDKNVLHRALSPQSILVTAPDSDRMRLKIFNWQTGSRASTTSFEVSRGITATSHIEQLVDDASTAYMAPEALTDDSPGEHLDVFSLGAIAYHVFSGIAPAANRLELANKLRETRGLSISSVLDGAGEWLQELILQATHPVVADRTDSVTDFLQTLDLVEEELTTPDDSQVDDPERAKTGDLLPGGYRVVRRIGEGGCSVVFLVERDGESHVLKVANSVDHNARIKEEADVLQRLRHAHIVQFVASTHVADRDAFLLRPVFSDRDKQQIETLGHRLKKEGRLHVDLLQRFGGDLLEIVKYLEDEGGIAHRDIKPENIAVGMTKAGDKLHLMLFDFSLSRTPPENIRAGTHGYLDPFLPLRKPPRWDLHAERYAVAVTLYEMATGMLPKWGDGRTEPSQLDAHVEVTLDAELFDSDLREPLSKFFRTALKRQPTERFESAESMGDEWRRCFDAIAEPGALSDHVDAASLHAVWRAATFDTLLIDLGLGTRATNALDRANIVDVAGLLCMNSATLWRARGVGKKTCREMLDCQSFLRKLLGKPPEENRILTGAAQSPTSSRDDATSSRDRQEAESDSVTQSAVASLGIDLIAARIAPSSTKSAGTDASIVRALLGLDEALHERWPSQTDVARHLQQTAAVVHQTLKKAIAAWDKEPALRAFRSDLVELVRAEGGVCVLSELPSALLAARGSAEQEPLRTRQALAVLRAAAEVERTRDEPRLVVRRDRDRVLIALHDDLVILATKLGQEADQLAQEDPLAQTGRALEQLQQIAAKFQSRDLSALTDNRLLRLAAAASVQSALSTKNEFYPRGMDALRALKLANSSLAYLRVRTIDAIQERVSDRYPEAEPLPGRPQLDDLLREAGLDFVWLHSGDDGRGCYVAKYVDDVSSTTGLRSRRSTASQLDPAREITPDEADARQFEDKLQRAVEEGSFLSLLINPRDFAQAQRELLRRFPLELVDFEGLFFDALQAETTKANVPWELVLQTDTTPNVGDWDKLLLLVKRAMPQIEQRLLSFDKTMLLIYPGLLARYGQMDLLSRLSQRVGRRDGIPGLWLLVPNEHFALIDHKPIPMIGTGQRTRIPASWLANYHRG